MNDNNLYFNTVRRFPELAKSLKEAEKVEHTIRVQNRRPNTCTAARDYKNQCLKENKYKEYMLSQKLKDLKCMNKEETAELARNWSDFNLRRRERGPEHGNGSEDNIDLSPLEAANRKLKKISVSFDSQSYNSHLAGFQGARLTKDDFATLLRRCLNITLRKAELDALFERMDADKSTLIDGVEFIRYFFHLGNEARWQMMLDTKEIQAKRIENMRKRRVAEEER